MDSKWQIRQEKITRVKSSNCSIKNMTKGNLAPHCGAFVSMKEAVLGAKYELSVVFASPKTLRDLNRAYRGKDKTADILSFPLSDSAGEIFINLEEARKEAKKFGRDFENFVGFLFIHGLVHLKGLRHGSRMEKLERKHRAKFGV